VSCKQGFKGKRLELVFCPVLEEKETVAFQDPTLLPVDQDPAFYHNTLQYQHLK
jgi:hypothetical protein